ncbi:MAG: Spy/CpxP family protein refolding chaperone [Myxococcales bacterium]|jgi:Spy/CpxP family protein refolding chaperone
MHPGMMWWWRQARHREHGSCGSQPGAGPEGYGFEFGWGRGGGFEGGSGAFGVRRPLRFLAFKLNLSEDQVAELAKILDELKTERAQAAVDDRRVTASFADSVASDQFEAEKAAEAGATRVKSAERLRDAVLKALARIHAILDKDQRQQLAYLIRTGALAI